MTIALLLMDSKCLNQQNDNERCEKHMNENGEVGFEKSWNQLLSKQHNEEKSLKELRNKYSTSRQSWTDKDGQRLTER